MERIFECIIAGGPQHGLICRRYWDKRQGVPLAVVTDDGYLCAAAARKHFNSDCTRFILLHPQATGEQFLTMLAA
jgi:hypothetical protein